MKPAKNKSPEVDPNQIWETDCTYFSTPVYAYLCVVLDRQSQNVLSWELSPTLDARFIIRAMQRAIAEHGKPEIVYTDHGYLFTSADLTQPILAEGIKLSVNGRNPSLDCVIVERLWRTLERENIFLKYCRSLSDVHAQLESYFRFHNERLLHTALEAGKQ